MFADAAARALLLFHDRPLLVVAHDRLIRTLLVTDEANFFRIPGNASCLVDMGNTHLEKSFLLNGKRSDRLGGADPSTEIAEFFTVADTGNEPRCVKTCQACLQKCGLKGIIWAYLQTFATACADGNKSLLRKSPWRTNEPVILQTALGLKRIGLDNQC